MAESYPRPRRRRPPPVRPPGAGRRGPLPRDRDGGSEPYRAPDEAEREYRRTHPHEPIPAPAYHALLPHGLNAPGRGADHARRQLDTIRTVLARGGWTAAERRTLSHARDRWQRRVDGHDWRYTLDGTTHPNQLTPHRRDTIAVLQIVEDVRADLRAILTQTPGASVAEPATPPQTAQEPACDPSDDDPAPS